MIFSSTYTLESKSCPGVTVTLRRMGRKPRGAVELQVAAARAKSRELAVSGVRLDAELQAALDAVPGYREKLKGLPRDTDGNLKDPMPAELLAMIPAEAWKLADEKARAEAQSKYLDEAEIYPAFIVAAVQSISGLEGATAATLCESGPDTLFDEVVTAINRNAYQTVEQAENLSSATTSGAQVDGMPTSTSASTASAPTTLST
jgi:hypothetical protein